MKSSVIDDIVRMCSGIRCIQIFASVTESLTAGTLLTYLVEEQIVVGENQKIIATNEFLLDVLGMNTAELQSAQDVLQKMDIAVADHHNPHGRTGYTLNHAVLVDKLQPLLIDKFGKLKAPAKEKKTPVVFDSSTVEYQLAQALLILIQRRQPNYFSKTLNSPAAKDQKLRKWAIQIDNLIRIDGRDPVEILSIIEWSQQDEFWQQNIKSTEKLRTQYGMLIDQQGYDNKEAPADTDEHPSLTRTITRRYEAKFLQRRHTTWNVLDKNKFILTSRKVVEFAKTASTVDELPVLLFRCLHKNYTEKGAPVHVGNCCSDHTWNVLMPQYLKEIGLPIARTKV